MAAAPFSPEHTRDGYLPPWELAKALAYQHVVLDMAQLWSITPAEVVGGRVDAWIASKVTLKGGGSPSERALRAALAKCADKDWFPGKLMQTTAGRKRLYSDHVVAETARVAMELKKTKVKVTPRNVRARLCRLTLNPQTGQPMSDWKFRQVFTTRCFDAREDDPWVFRRCLKSDYLPADMKPRRKATAEFLLAQPAGSWFNHVAIDPCASLLPKTATRLEEQQVAALGNARWMSKHSARDNENLAASEAAIKQAGNNVRKVHWTPVLCRGKIRIYVCDAAAAEDDDLLPKKLNHSAELGKFVRNVLPGILSEMAEAHGWHSVPRTVVHDKASYMVAPHHDRLNTVFAAALEEGGFRSWIGSPADPGNWLAARFADVYPHETAISHIRRLLDTKFTCARLGETAGQLRVRMTKVEAFMNSDEFVADFGGGLLGLCKSLRQRCEEVVRRDGGRIPK